MLQFIDKSPIIRTGPYPENAGSEAFQPEGARKLLVMLRPAPAFNMSILVLEPRARRSYIHSISDVHQPVANRRSIDVEGARHKWADIGPEGS